MLLLLYIVYGIVPREGKSNAFDTAARDEPEARAGKIYRDVREIQCTMRLQQI